MFKDTCFGVNGEFHALKAQQERCNKKIYSGRILFQITQIPANPSQPNKQQSFITLITATIQHNQSTRQSISLPPPTNQTSFFRKQRSTKLICLVRSHSNSQFISKQNTPNSPAFLFFQAVDSAFCQNRKREYQKHIQNQSPSNWLFKRIFRT